MAKPVITHQEIGYKMDWDAVDEYERQKAQKQIEVEEVEEF